MMRVPKRIVVGEIVSTQGLKGEMRIRPLTDFPERFGHTKELVAVHPTGRSMVFTPVTARQQGRVIILKCAELDSIEEVKPWIGAELTIDSSELMPLPEGRYYVFQLIGLKVFTEAGLYLGELSDVLFPGANDVYVIKLSEEAKAKVVYCDGKELLLPVIDEVILDTDLEQGKMTVRLLEGLL